ncbi:ferrous iron transport protein A [Neobacillus notoginsengisoli]|uniref:Ferrous iron transport protein A n=1 Tax=Neobacillus notoginsengisoli TaxID=1578198 RepID=A0A417YLB1_9BACI|nr:FeoA family protein [Neobacillus notoginsengisoli]RHW34174.1 ferrous iron transport protein A [Neobacillus notoginsengisoli]
MNMLAQLKPGEKATIKDISLVDGLVQRRLLDLGITEGSEICVKCKLPFGGPIMIESCGQCVGIRQKEAKCIELERV